jgi:ATP phosphoribosyltransferase regulatory subunit
LLSSDHLPKTTPAIDWLVIPQTPDVEIAAFRYAQSLRSNDDSLRVELDLGQRTETEIKDYALDCQIQQLAWVSPEGQIRTEVLSKSSY